MTTIYLDSAASTRVDERVIARMTEVMRAAWANPSAAHPAGADARRWLARGRAEVAAALGGSGGQVVFTSGATEADALAVLGAARARGRGRIVISAFEHAAVGATARALADDGFEIVELGATPAGAIDLAQLDAALTADTVVVAALAVQNELGTVQPIEALVRRARAAAPGAHVHIDAAQALGKIALDADALGADSIAIAAHKLGGPKGTGALWLAAGARLAPLWRGGGQEGGLRSGTEDAPGAAGFGLAATLAIAARAEATARWTAMAARLCAAAAASGVAWRDLAAGAPRAPHILALAFEGVAAGALRQVLASRGVHVSSGSACAEAKAGAAKPSTALAAIGLDPGWGMARLSFGLDTTDAEIDRAAAILSDAVRGLR